MASTNDEDFLTDHSGSRRYLCFKVLDISLDYKKINMDEVWAEAFHLYNSKNFTYWIDTADTDELHANNKAFTSINQEHEYTMQYFTRPSDTHPATHIAPATVLRDYLRIETNNQQLKERNIGVALKDLGFEQSSRRFDHVHFPVKGWEVTLNSTTEFKTLNKFLI